MNIPTLRIWFRFVRLVLVLLVSSQSLQVAANDVAYLRDIRPLFKERCFACHGALKQEAGLRLDTGAMVRAGGDSGEAVLPGEPRQSLLIERVTASNVDERMPPEGMPLTPAQIADVRRWIESGAISPPDEQPEADPDKHWSFQPLRRPRVPETVGNDTAANPIDAFIDRRLREHQTRPQTTASKPVLLRRAYLDLVGLPPTPEELHDFLDDDSEEAWSNLINRLLDDPKHAERWARHWMDVWRYADWYGRRNVPDVWNSAHRSGDGVIGSYSQSMKIRATTK